MPNALRIIVLIGFFLKPMSMLAALTRVLPAEQIAGNNQLAWTLYEKLQSAQTKVLLISPVLIQKSLAPLMLTVDLRLATFFSNQFNMPTNRNLTEQWFYGLDPFLRTAMGSQARFLSYYALIGPEKSDLRSSVARSFARQHSLNMYPWQDFSHIESLYGKLDQDTQRALSQKADSKNFQPAKQPSEFHIFTAGYFDLSWHTRFPLKMRKDEFIDFQGHKHLLDFFSGPTIARISSVRNYKLLALPLAASELEFWILTPNEKISINQINISKAFKDFLFTDAPWRRVDFSMPKLAFNQTFDFTRIIQQTEFKSLNKPSSFERVYRKSPQTLGSLTMTVGIEADQTGKKIKIEQLARQLGVKRKRPQAFAVRRSFLFFLTHRKSGLIVAMGHYQQPPQGQ